MKVRPRRGRAREPENFLVSKYWGWKRAKLRDWQNPASVPVSLFTGLWPQPMALTSLSPFLHQVKLRMIRSRLQVLINSYLVCNLNKQTTATPGVSTHTSQFWSQDGRSRKHSASPAGQTGWKGGGATCPHTPEPPEEPAVPKRSPPSRRSLCASLATPAATLWEGFTFARTSFLET